MAATPDAPDDLYEVLGISRTAAVEEVKKAYRKGSLRWHPDKNPDDTQRAKIMFCKIGEAYRTLSDPKLRAEYDRKVAADAAAAAEAKKSAGRAKPRPQPVRQREPEPTMESAFSTFEQFFQGTDPFKDFDTLFQMPSGFDFGPPPGSKKQQAPFWNSSHAPGQLGASGFNSGPGWASGAQQFGGSVSSSRTETVTVNGVQMSRTQTMNQPGVRPPMSAPPSVGSGWAQQPQLQHGSQPMHPGQQPQNFPQGYGQDQYGNVIPQGALQGWPPQQGMRPPPHGIQPQGGAWSAQPGAWPQQSGGWPQQPGGYPQQPGGYPQQPGGYPQQPGGYPQQPGGYPQQPGTWSQQPRGRPPQPPQDPGEGSDRTFSSTLETVSSTIHRIGMLALLGAGSYVVVKIVGSCWKTWRRTFFWFLP